MRGRWERRNGVHACKTRVISSGFAYTIRSRAIGASAPQLLVI